MNIDWSKAPEGATHCLSGRDFFKLDGDGRVILFINGSTHNTLNHIGDFLSSSIVERPKKQEVWDGVCIPTVGMECEVFEGPALWRNSGMSDWVGRKVKVKSTFINNIGQKIASVESDNGECACFIVECLRPIKTAEKLAEEEKVAAIAEMQAVVMAASGCTVSTISEILAIVALYEAGYRKQ